METSFILTLDGTDYAVEVHGNTFTINGHPFVVGFEDDGYVTVDGIAHNATLDGDKAIVDDTVYELQVSGLATEPTTVGAARPTSTTPGAGVIQAIMPGSIVRVLVSAGEEVAAGDVLLVLEAMKMENELQSPISGIVKAIHVQPGQAVEMNATLVEIEPLD